MSECERNIWNIKTWPWWGSRWEGWRRWRGWGCIRPGLRRPARFWLDCARILKTGLCRPANQILIRLCIAMCKDLENKIDNSCTILHCRCYNSSLWHQSLMNSHFALFGEVPAMCRTPKTCQNFRLLDSQFETTFPQVLNLTLFGELPVFWLVKTLFRLPVISTFQKC